MIAIGFMPTFINYAATGSMEVENQGLRLLSDSSLRVRSNYVRIETGSTFTEAANPRYYRLLRIRNSDTASRLSDCLVNTVFQLRYLEIPTLNDGWPNKCLLELRSVQLNELE